MHLDFDDVLVIKNAFGANPSTADKIISLLTEKSDSIPRDGQDGEDGEDGSVWFVQSYAPEKARGVDIWLNADTGDVYKIIGDRWQVVACIKGKNGEDGKGERGDTPTLVIGSVETLAPYSNVKASILATKNPNEYAINLAIPIGGDGEAPTLTEGEVIMLPSDKKPKITITGTHPNYQVSFAIPQGEKGEKGESVKGDTGELEKYRDTQRLIAQDGSSHYVKDTTRPEVLLIVSGNPCSQMIIELPDYDTDKIIKIISKVPVKNIQWNPSERIASKIESFSINGFYELFYEAESKIFYRTR